jgi:bacillolysin
MKNRIFFLLLILLSASGFLVAQTEYPFWNNEMSKIATETSNESWINIKPGVTISPLTFFADQKKALGLAVNDEMKLYKTEQDQIGFTHYRFQQYYKGLKVISGEFLLHAKEGKLITANGNMIRGLIKNAVSSISKETALQQALRFFPSPQYAWEIPQLENNKKLILHDPLATYKPMGELVWVSTDKEDNIKKAGAYELAYMFDIYTSGLNGKKIFISATRADVVQSFSLTPTCDGTSVTTNFYGSQGFSTRLIPGSAPPRHNLWNDCGPAFIRTMLWGAAGNTDYTSNAGNNWTSVPSAATSHWGVEKSYDYFFNIHGRNGWNNANGGVFILQDALFNCGPPSPCTTGQNASFSNGTMMVGNSDNSNSIDDWNSLDIIAHEFAHGVTESSANLFYSRESGALNESFSDIFGASCHAWLFGLGSNTWKVGFDRKNPVNTAVSIYIRNMADPNDRNDPDTYLTGPQWVSTTTPTDISGDNWGVHTNSGVQNYMFYLLTGGGSGINDNGTAYSVLGIGLAAARHIAYRTLNFYLTSFSNYTDARNAWVRAAVDEYGVCSFQAIETGKAWNAVGLAPPVSIQTTPYCGTYGGSIFSLTSPSIYSLAPGCIMTVTPSSLVQFGANKVILNPGFRAQAGSNFRAYVSDCRYSTY